MRASTLALAIALAGCETTSRGLHVEWDAAEHPVPYAGARGRLHVVAPQATQAQGAPDAAHPATVPDAAADAHAPDPGPGAQPDGPATKADTPPGQQAHADAKIDAKPEPDARPDVAADMPDTRPDVQGERKSDALLSLCSGVTDIDGCYLERNDAGVMPLLSKDGMSCFKCTVRHLMQVRSGCYWPGPDGAPVLCIGHCRECL